jgi:hypothetical protein
VCGPSKKYVTYEELVKHKIGNHIYVAPNRSSHSKKKNTGDPARHAYRFKFKFKKKKNDGKSYNVAH